jgi:hypothetical protein
MATMVRETRDRREGRVRAGGVVAGALALTAGVFAVAARLGFNPTDDGYILAQSYRILQGQVPHLDFISPRPVGSPIIHLLDFALPLPLIVASRLVTTAELVGTAVLVGWFVIGRSPARWRAWEGVAVAASALISIHGFPLMDWHTIDGLLLVALGFVLVQYPRTTVAGFIALGAALVVKQSFFLAPLLGVAMVTARTAPAARFATALRSILLAAVPGALYVIVISAFGAFPSFVRQITGARPIYGRDLINEMLTGGDLARLAVVVALLIAVVATDARPRGWIGTGLRVALTAVVVGTALQQHLQLYGTWADQLEEIAGVVVLWHMWRRRRVDWPGIALVGTGWMVSLSWGYAVPNLIAGGLVLLAVIRIWDGHTIATQPGALVSALVAVAVFAATAAVFVHTRRTDIYRDRPASQLTFPLSRIAPDFGSIRTNPETGAYLTDMKTCIREMPARRVAMLPNNAAMYPVLHLHDPLPLDWLWIDEIGGSDAQILSAARALDQQGDYLVLFETQDASVVPIEGLQPGPAALAPDILGVLHGRQSRCGPFIAVYSPPSAAR